MAGIRQGILGAIVSFSIRYRWIVIVLAFCLIGYAMFTLFNARYDVFPEFAPPQVVIRTESPGLTPEQVEVLVTTPVENVVNGIAGVESVRSNSIQGLSAVTVKFKTGSNIFRARQEVAERLASLTGLPGNASPRMTALTSSTGTIMMVGLLSKNLSLMDLRSFADWTVKPRFLAVQGVAKVAVFGSGAKQIQIKIRPERLIKYSLSMGDLIAASRLATAVRGAGFIDTGNQQIDLKPEGQPSSAEEIGNSVVSFIAGVPLRLRDVADVADGTEPPIGAAGVMGREGVILVASTQYGANTLEVTKKLEQAIADLSPVLKEKEIEIYPDLLKPANFIETSLRNIWSSFKIGAVLVVVVLFLFLFNVRTALISCIAIPLSLLSAATILIHFGYTMNVMVMGGLAIAIGEVVDDAVIDVENILRRLRENKQSENPRAPAPVILKASLEVRSAVIYATFCVVLVFVPLLTLSGTSGRIFSPIGIAYITAVLASLVVALTVTPALCMLLIGEKGISAKEPRFLKHLKDRYARLLYRVERNRRIVISGVAIFVALGLALTFFLSTQFLPEFREGQYIVHVSSLPGTSLQETIRLGNRLSIDLMKNPFVESVSQQAGRAEMGEETRGSNASEFNVRLTPNVGTREDQVRTDLEQSIGRFAGINYSTNTFLKERIEETVSGYRAPLVVNIFGKDLDLLDAKAEEISRVLAGIPDVSGVQVQSPPGIPQITIALKKEELTRWGLDPVSALDVIETAYQGKTVGHVYTGNRIYDVSVILDPEFRRNIADVGLLTLRNSSGSFVPLRQIADISQTAGRSSVLHDGGRRVQAVTCQIKGAGSSAFEEKARQELSRIPLPQGMYIEFSGTSREQARAQKDLLVHSILAGIGILLLLSVVLGNFRNMLLVLSNLPFALVGGVLIVFLSGSRLSLGSIVGFVTLFGITLRNSIMLISHYEHLVSLENAEWGTATAVRGAVERLAPILMTALVTGLGLLPLAIGSGTAGREVEGPLAVVILGGLITSTALNLLVLPTLSVRFGSFGKRDT